MEPNGVLLDKPLFGGKIIVILYDVDETFGKEILDETYEFALKLQKTFNFYDNESELSILNKKRKLTVSHDLLHVIKNALGFCRLTEGQYDISLGKNILEKKEGKEVKQLSKLECSYKDIKILGGTIILKHPDAMIDLGSIAKGYITDKIVEFLEKQGIENFIIDSRGDIFIFGDYMHILKIQHPREKDKSVCKLKLNNIAVATSGDYRQYKDSFDNSHILNQKEIVSITVAADTLEQADAWSTALFVCNDKKRGELLKNKKEIKVLTIDNALALKTYNGFDSLFYEKDNKEAMITK